MSDRMLIDDLRTQISDLRHEVKREQDMTNALTGTVRDLAKDLYALTVELETQWTRRSKD
jgi:hypothetical protein